MPDTTPPAPDFSAMLSALPPLQVAGERAAVGETADLRRIRSAPWRPWQDAADLETGRAALTNWLRVSGGTRELLPVQAATLGTLMANAKRGFGVFAPIRTGGGKALDVREPVATPYGWAEIGSLQPGDAVLGASGTACQVLGVHPQGRKALYRVTFSDGSHSDCTADHLWTFRNLHGRVVTRKLSAWQAVPLRAGPDNRLQWWLPRHGAAQFATPAVLPVDPYTLGALLGDGGLTGRYPKFTSMDQDIVDALVLPPGVVPRIEKCQGSGLATGYSLTGRKGHTNPLTTTLRALGVMGLRSEHKHIPAQYKYAFTHDRIALLQGLFDTDGARHRGAVDFSSASLQLALDVQEIVEGLGGTATLSHAPTTHLDRHRLYARLPSEMPLFRCARKRGAAPAKEPHRAVVGIEALGRTEEAVCIQVDAPDQLFRTRRHVVTHNTDISLLAPTCTGLSYVHLVPASLRDKTQRAAYALAKHYRVCPPRILSYEGLSQAKNAEILLTWQPQLIIADEAHMLGDSSGTRWARIKRYRKWCVDQGRPGPIPLLMSGSFTSRSIREYAHLLRWCLGESAPIPRDVMELQRWGLVLDEKVPDGARLEPGALLSLAPPHEDDGYGREAARARYGRRLMATAGVIGTGGDIPANGLEVEIVRLPPSAAISAAVEDVRATWEIGGMPFESSMDLWRHERTLSCGLYYRPKVEPPKEWMLRRRELSRAVREVLSASHTIDTPLQLRQHAHNGDRRFAHLLPLYAAWGEIEPTYTWVSVPVWICPSTLEFAAEWLAREKGICWVHHRAFGTALEERTKVPYFAEQGQNALGVSIDMHDGPAIASIRSCSRGFDLQGTPTTRAAHHKNLVVTSPTKGSWYEQLISRTHRDGQQQPTVAVAVLERLEGDAKALAQARADSDMTARTLQQPQRLSIATFPEE